MRRARKNGLRVERPTLYRVPRKRGEDLTDLFAEFHEARTEDEHDRLSQRRLRAERNE